MAAPRRSALGTRLFLSLAAMLVPLALVGAAGLVSQYRNAAEQSRVATEALGELRATAAARDAVVDGDRRAIEKVFATLPQSFDDAHELALVEKARDLQRRGSDRKRIRDQLAALRRLALEELDSGAAASRRTTDTQLAALIALLVLGVGFAIVLATRLRRRIVDPLRALHRAAVRVAHDDFSIPVDASSADEIGDVGGAFNAMMERLRESRSELLHQAFHDALTGLPNRELFSDRTQQALRRAHSGRGADRHVAVLFLDLDDFKGVNDGFGHSAGDELLKTVAARLRDTLRTEETIARLGGDEFAVLLEQVPGPEEAELAADRLLEALAEPVIIAGREHHPNASVGVALSTGRDDTAGELLRNADVAMYAAKAAGRGRRELFEPAMHSAVFTRMALESDLRRGVERGEFRLVYQPVLDLETSRTVAVEALLRWDHPERGTVPPLDFIPVAERSGLIVPLGRWVIDEATRQAAIFQKLPSGGAGLTMAVNLSPRQLLDPGLVDHVAAAIERSGIAPGTLVLELTESLLMADVDETVPVLAALKRLGVLLALDDIGTGYSSLSYLRRFPIDILKLDRELVSGDAHDTKLARALVGLGRDLELATVAEGIEQPEQLAEMRRLGCELGQGYLFAQPMPPEQLAASLGELGAAA